MKNRNFTCRTLGGDRYYSDPGGLLLPALNKARGKAEPIMRRQLDKSARRSRCMSMITMVFCRNTEMERSVGANKRCAVT